MIRSLVCAVVALFFVSGLALAADTKAEKKKKGAGITGKVKSIDAEKGVVVLSVGKKGQEMDKEITIGDDVKFVIQIGEEKKELSGKAGLKSEEFKVGANVSVKMEGDKVVGVMINKKKPK